MKKQKHKKPQIRHKQLNVNLIHLIIIAISFALYGNSLQNGYVLDDAIVITRNSFVQQGLAGIDDIFSGDAFIGAFNEQLKLGGGRYRPLSIATFAIENQFFGNNAGGSHFFNVLLYALTNCLVFLLFYRIIFRKKLVLAAVATALFLFHPLHTEVVANIKGRDEIMALLFSLLSVYLVFRKQKKWQYVAVFSFFLALLSKENAITFLAIIPLSLYFFGKISKGEILRKSLPFWLVTGLYLWLRFAAVGFPEMGSATQLIDNPYLNAPFFDKMATLTLIAGKYIALQFFPQPLSFDYSFNQIPAVSWLNVWAVSSLIISVLSVFFAFKFAKQKRIIAFGIFYYWLTFSIVSNFVFNIGTAMGERFIYMPSLGFVLIISVLLNKLLKFETQKATPLPSLILKLSPVLIILLLFSVKTIGRNRAWHDNLTLYKTDSQTVINSARVHLYYGIELLNRYKASQQAADLKRSIEEMEWACRIEPNFYHAYYNLALAYQQNREFDRAIAAFERVLEIAPLHIDSHAGLGLTWGKGKGDFKKALHYFEIVLFKFKQESPDLYANTAIAYAMLQQNEKARNLLETALKKYPQAATLYLNLGINYLNSGETEKGKRLLEQAFALQADLREKFKNL